MKPLRWVVGVVVLGGLGAFGVWAFLEGRREQARERERERPVKPPSRVTKGEGGMPVVKLDAAAVARIGLRVEAVNPAEHRPEVLAFGRVEVDPSSTQVVRAPIGGVLRGPKEGGWPRLGVTIEDGAEVGSVEPRVGPVERADLDARVRDWRARAAGARADAADAHAKAESAAADRGGAEAALAVAKASLERLKALQGPEKNVSERAVQEAEAKARAEEARVQSLLAVEEGERVRERESTAVRKILEEAAESAPTVDRAWPVRIGQGGEVVEIHSQPGETVDAAQPLLRLARFDEVLVRATLPLGDRLPQGATEGRVFFLGREGAPVGGTIVGRGADASSATGGEVVLVRVGAADGSLRPGLSATVRIVGAGAPASGVEIPRGAVVRFGGSTWAYVETDEGVFARRLIPLDRPTRDGWFVASGFKAGERVVTVGGPTLLSEEQKAQIQALGEGGGGEGD